MIKEIHGPVAKVKELLRKPEPGAKLMNWMEKLPAMPRISGKPATPKRSTCISMDSPVAFSPISRRINRASGGADGRWNTPGLPIPSSPRPFRGVAVGPGERAARRA